MGEGWEFLKSAATHGALGKIINREYNIGEYRRIYRRGNKSLSYMDLVTRLEKLFPSLIDKLVEMLETNACYLLRGSTSCLIPFMPFRKIWSGH